MRTFFPYFLCFMFGFLVGVGACFIGIVRKGHVAVLLLLLALPVLSMGQERCPCEPVASAVTRTIVLKVIPVDQWTTTLTSLPAKCACQSAVTALTVIPLPQEPTKEPAVVAQRQNNPSRYDWSFAKDPKFYAGVGFSFAVTAYDISTSHGQEATRFYRNDQGQLNKGKYWLVTGGVNAALLPLDLMPNHKWRWVSLGARVGLALVRWNVARGNR